MTKPTAENPQHVSQPNPAGGLPLVCSYWHVENVRPGNDAWRYQLSTGETYSHVCERGCEIMIRKHWIEVGAIIIPEDNGHLDHDDAERWEKITAHWLSYADEGPRTGDFVIMPDGRMKRFCYNHGCGLQTTNALQASYHMTERGHVSYSGGLDAMELREFLTDTGETRRGRFWFWHHGLPGGGRGVDGWADCKIYRLERRNLTEEEAWKHPETLSRVKNWGKGDRITRDWVAELMTAADRGAMRDEREAARLEAKR